MSSRRKSPSSEFPKKSRSISFVGKEGYDILDFFDEEGDKFEYGKSGLVIELLKLYREALNIYPREEVIFRIRMCMELDKRVDK